MFKQALPDLASPVYPPSCPVCNAEPLHHHILAPDTSPHLPRHSAKYLGSLLPHLKNPTKNKKILKYLLPKCHDLGASTRNLNVWGRTIEMSEQERAPGACLSQLRASSLFLTFVQGGQMRTLQPWVGLWVVTPAALTGACVPGDPLQQFPCDCSYQLLKIRGNLE